MNCLSDVTGFKITCIAWCIHESDVYKNMNCLSDGQGFKTIMMRSYKTTKYLSDVMTKKMTKWRYRF